MSVYASQEEKVILKDNDEITSIDLEYNRNLKVLIIDNLPNLETVNISITDGLYVSISNCEKLTYITSSSRYLDYDQYGSYLYLGENLKFLDCIDLEIFNTVKIADEVFDKLESVSLSHIKSLICDFKNFPKLDDLSLEHVATSNLIINSETISFFIISHCSFENIEIIGNGDINYIEFNNNEYKSLKTENPIKSSHITIYHDDNKFIPYISLCDKINDNLNLYLNINNIYDFEYKFFIERNSSKLKLLDINFKHIELDLNNIKFNVPQKKRAR